MDFLNHPITDTRLIWGSVILTFVWVVGLVVAYIAGFTDGTKQTKKEFYYGDD